MVIQLYFQIVHSFILFSLLPVPLKVDGGNVVTPVCLSVCLCFICEQYISKCYGQSRTKLGVQVGCVTRKNG